MNQVGDDDGVFEVNGFFLVDCAGCGRVHPDVAWEDCRRWDTCPKCGDAHKDGQTDKIIGPCWPYEDEIT